MESERPIEKLLRASAKKRQEEAGGPFELHPATRRLLQGEVARTIKPARPTAPGRPGQSLWFRLAWSFGVVAGVALAAVLMVPEWHREEPKMIAVSAPAQPAPAAGDLAFNRLLDRSEAEKETPQSKAENVPPPGVGSLSAEALTNLGVTREMAATPFREPLRENQPATATLRLSNESALAEADQARKQVQTPLSLAAQSPPATTPAPAITLAPATTQPAVASQGFGGNVAVRSRMQTDAAAVSPAAPSQQLATAGTAGAGRADADQSFNDFQKAPQSFKKLPETAPAEAKDKVNEMAVISPVLASFQVQQVGSELRITDQDGSLYTGTWQLTANVDALNRRAADVLKMKEARREESARFALPAASPPQARYFVVSGTNRTLKVPVVFTGTVATAALLNGAGAGLTLTNGGENFFKGGVQAGAEATGGRTNLAPAAVRISGKATIGRDQVINVEAVPVPK